MLRSFFAVVVFSACLAGVACGVPPPDRLEITPPAAIKSQEMGQTFALKAKAWRGIVEHDDPKGPVAFTWASSDPGVATVDNSGTVTITGSGRAKITVSAAGRDGTIREDVDVNNLIVDSVTATGDFPKKFRLDSPPVKLTVVVKNEKGVVIDKPKLRMSASDYCVEVTPEGMVYPLAVGQCSAIVEVAGKRAKIDLDVKE